MKKILLLLVLLPIFMTSCSNDDESTEQTFFVNVYTKWEDSEEKVAKKAFLYIYENENKSIDNSQSTISVVNDGLITYTDGSLSLIHI